MRLRPVAIAAALLLGCGVVSPPSSQADPRNPPEVLSIVHLGDSYSAGNGAGSYHGVPQCQQSQVNWGQRFADWVSSLGVHVTYTNRACSGGTIKDLFKQRELADQSERLIVGKSEAEVRQVLEEFGACDVSSFEEATEGEVQIRPLGIGPQGKQMFAYHCVTLLAPQAEAVTASTDLVLISMAGNDLGFDAIVKNCFAPTIIPRIFEGASAESCESSVGQAAGKLPDVLDELKRNLEQLIETRMSGNPTSQIVLMNYPKLATAAPYLLRYETPDLNGKPRYYDSAAQVRALSDEAREHQRRIVDQLNAQYPGRVMLIESTPEAFAGHEPNPESGKANPQRWINEFLETEGDYSPGGEIASRFSPTITNYWHPNIVGHRELGRLVAASGVNTSVPLLSGWGQQMDVVLVVDATLSMARRWGYVKNAVKQVQAQLAETDARMALVTYQDHPEGGGEPGNYPARVAQDFTTQADAILRALDDVELAPAGDVRESVYSGIDTGLDLKWRRGAKKIMLVLGDGPAKDPEPVTGLTAERIARKAFEVDPAEVFVVGTSETDPHGDGLSQVAEDTGGEVLTADDPATLPESATQALSRAAVRPFGWLQGPYVAKVGSTVRLDARGSFSPAGPIVTYEWDFDGNGTWDQTTTTGEAEFTYGSQLEGFVGVRVTDATGATALGSTRIWITPDGDIINDQFDNCPDVANPTQQDLDQNWIGDECEDPNKFQVEPPPARTEPTPIPTITPSPVPTATPTPTVTPTATATPSSTATPTPSPSPSVRPTEQPTITPTGQQPTTSPSPSASSSSIPAPTAPTGSPSPTTMRPSGPSTPSPSRPSVPSGPPTPVPIKPGPPRTGHS